MSTIYINLNQDTNVHTMYQTISIFTTVTYCIITICYKISTETQSLKVRKTLMNIQVFKTHTILGPNHSAEIDALKSRRMLRGMKNVIHKE